MCSLTSEWVGREWVERLAGLAVDKHLEVRRTAEQALARVHSLVDSSALREHLDAVDLASDIRTTLLQILQVAACAPCRCLTQLLPLTMPFHQSQRCFSSWLSYIAIQTAL